MTGNFYYYAALLFFVFIYVIYKISYNIAFKKISKFYNISIIGNPPKTKHVFGESIDYVPLKVQSRKIKDQDNIIIDLIETQDMGIVPAITSKDLIERIEIEAVDSTGKLYTFKTYDEDAKFLKSGDDIYGLMCGNKLYGVAINKSITARKIGEKALNTMAKGIAQRVIRDSDYLFSNHEAN